MIQVTYYRNHHRVTVVGHARSADPGHDLVCAGASTLAYTLAAWVRNLDARGQVRTALVKLEPGDAELSCVPRTKYSSVVTLIFDTVCAGFELLARDNAAYISYEIHQG